ncbi:MAG TPA: plastocyanin/azurin family copper-binding protein [Gaiellaceae bacterium]|nr:plastocyanin/azurin family copper-binding protein [Gaiellaceae bacterium]
MHIRTLVVAAAIAVTLAGVGAATAARSAAPKLKGTVGPGFTISLKTATGRTVTTLKAGTYTIVVSDRSAIHSFVLEGPGVERDITTPSFVGTKTVTVKLRKGKYKFYCRPHESTMFGFVKVT